MLGIILGGCLALIASIFEHSEGGKIALSSIGAVFILFPLMAILVVYQKPNKPQRKEPA
jgi:succinate-acetate transporter protein